MKRIIVIAALCVFGAGLQAATLAVDTVNARFTLDGEPFFPICTSHQRVDAFQFWADMGCNVTTYIESPNTWEQWTAALESSGLYGMPYGTSYLTRRHPRCIGYYISGEPDISKDGNPPPNTPLASLLATVAQGRASAPDFPLFICYAGMHVLVHFNTDEGEIYYRTASNAVDWVCQDIYPIMDDQSMENAYNIARVTDDLTDFVGGKRPVGAFIESGRIAASPGRGPTPGEFEAQVWTAVGAGCKAILYFPIAFDPWDRNNMDQDVPMQNKMKAVNATITGMTDVLMQDRISMTGFRRSFTGGAIQMKLYYRRHGLDLYVFSVATRAEVTSYDLEFAYDGPTAVEVVGESRTLTYAGGKISDSFTADNTAHIYKLTDYFDPADTTSSVHTAGTVREPAVRVGSAHPVARATDIVVSVPSRTRVSYRLFDAAGNEVVHGRSVTLEAGRHRLLQDAVLPGNGVYQLVVVGGVETVVRQIVIVK